MTQKQKKFVENYCDSGCGADAARKAGYNTDRPDQIAYENLRKPEIKAAVSELLDSKGVTRHRLIDTLNDGLNANIIKVFNNNGEIIESDPYVDHVTRCRYLEIGLKLHDMFPADKQEVTHNITPDAEKAAVERVEKLFNNKKEEQKKCKKQE